MSLRVWLPLTKDLRQQGLDNWIFSSYGTVTQPNTGKLGNCLQTGATGTVYNNNISLTLNGNFSIGYWLRIDAYQTSWNNFFTLDYDGNHWCGMCYNNSSNGSAIGWHVRVDINGTATNIFDRYAFTGLTVGQWYHIGLTMENGTTCKMYLNGALIYTGNTSATYPTTTYTRLILGSKNYNNSYSNCSINDFRVYDHTLSQMEVKELAKGLVLHYPLSDRYIESTTNLASTLTFGRYSGWNSITFTHLEKDSYHVRNGNSATSYWDSCGFDVSAYIGQTITFSATIANLTTSNCNVSWIAIGQANSGQYQNHIVSSGTGNFKQYTQTTANNKRLTWTGEIISPGRVLIEIWNENTVSGGYAEFDLLDVQIELKDHATPYAYISRQEDIVYDCSGFLNNGLKVGDLICTNDTIKYSACTKFNNNCYIKYKAPEYMYQITYAFWVKQPSFPSYNMIHGPLGSPTGGTSPWFSMNTESAKAWAYFGGNSPYYHSVSGTSNVNEWYHLVWVFDNGVARWYINGEPSGNAVTYTNKTYIPNTEENSIGDSYTGSSWSGAGFEGWLSDFRIYATVLSAKDIKSLYQNSAYIDNNGNIYGAVHTEI